MSDEKSNFENEMMLFNILSMMQTPPQLHVWNVKYADKNGNIYNIRYSTATKDEAIRLFRSEQDKGDVIKSIRKVREKHV